MPEGIEQLEQWAQGLITSLEPAARRKLAREIAVTLVNANKSRIAAQCNLDGSAYQKRKFRLRDLQAGKLRNRMFGKIASAKYLKTSATADAAMVGFTQQVSRIAKVHQMGLRDRVEPHGPQVQYARRELIGLTDHDFEALSGVVEKHLGVGWL